MRLAIVALWSAMAKIRPDDHLGAPLLLLIERRVQMEPLLNSELDSDDPKNLVPFSKDEAEYLLHDLLERVSAGNFKPTRYDLAAIETLVKRKRFMISSAEFNQVFPDHLED
jgi:hypothetical protein